MRARNLKPSLFKNEDLGTGDPLYTIVFEGLWCLADREGRLEDRPLRIHAEVNPYRPSASTVQALDWLCARQFIRRYRVDGVAYIEVQTFKDHQNPHIREPKSGIPGPENADQNQEDVVAPDKHGAGTVPTLDEHQSGPADSPFRIPPSPFPLPDCARPVPGSARAKSKRSAGKRKSAEEPPEFQAIRDAYPKRAGTQRWTEALANCRRLVGEGVPWADLTAAAERYARFCDATGKTGTETAMQAASFFGKNQCWREDYTPPPASAPRQRAKTVAELEAEEAARATR